MSIRLICCTIVSNRQDACSTKNEFSCGVGILPACERLIDIGARSELNLDHISCGTGILPVQDWLF
ncbi:hypothetical protein CP500_003165 [Tychonema bourrellyi FEM_GT703]|uniref:Uncharacterized protein n=1 Tax=Tychonema bourrellyi FEM_GT703 TaxID=2040638 RepID=A0A2G4F578_9CYAN|nr:hypothetical protein CP500_003165 [Tychonema bourrellyi FEM_GT703]